MVLHPFLIHQKSYLSISDSEEAIFIFVSPQGVHAGVRHEALCLLHDVGYFAHVRII